MSALTHPHVWVAVCFYLLSLQHLVDLFGQFYGLMRHLLPRLLLLLRSFISRSHASLASVGVAAYARLVSSCGRQLDAQGWQEVRGGLGVGWGGGVWRGVGGGEGGSQRY